MGTVAINPPELPGLTGVISHGVAIPSIGLVFTAGQVAWDAEGNLACGDDLTAQFEKAYDNIEIVLLAAGSTRDRIVKETIYLAGYTTAQTPELMSALVAARKGHTTPPASTAVGVTTLYADEFLVEIEVVAVI